jgi:hypothetical protein
MKDVTPKHMRCTYMAGCPSIHELEDGRLLIVGKMAAYPGHSYQGVPIGPGEDAMIIDKALLSTIRDEVREECAVRLDDLAAKSEAMGRECGDLINAARVIRALKETPHE